MDRVPERPNSGPCRHCGQDHPDERCPWEKEEEEEDGRSLSITHDRS